MEVDFTSFHGIHATFQPTWRENGALVATDGLFFLPTPSVQRSSQQWSTEWPMSTRHSFPHLAIDRWQLHEQQKKVVRSSIATNTIRRKKIMVVIVFWICPLDYLVIFVAEKKRGFIFRKRRSTVQLKRQSNSWVHIVHDFGCCAYTNGIIKTQELVLCCLNFRQCAFSLTHHFNQCFQHWSFFRCVGHQSELC